jgi:hypothetical protein
VLLEISRLMSLTSKLSRARWSMASAISRRPVPNGRIVTTRAGIEHWEPY